MRPPVRRIPPWPFFLGLCGLIFTGCEALSPTQLWKLNRHPRESYGGDAYFSIPSSELPASSAGDSPAQAAEIPSVPAF